MPYDYDDDYYQGSERQVQPTNTTNQDFNWFGWFGNDEQKPIQPETFVPTQNPRDGGNWFSDLLNFGYKVDETLFRRELLRAKRSRQLIDATVPSDTLTPPPPVRYELEPGLPGLPNRSPFQDFIPTIPVDTKLEISTETYVGIAVLAGIILVGTVIAKKV